MITSTANVIRDGTWQADPGFGIYVHVPFCMHRCHYCDFNTYEGLDSLHEPYVEALVDEIARDARGGRAATSVFFGGGTPTLLTASQLARIVDAIDERFGIAEGAEITVEANPETIDPAYLRALRAAGFNRISIGVQSLAPAVLEKLGRTHSAGRALEALEDARGAGFQDVNADLIYGSPWESESDWVTSLTGIVELSPDHVSAYGLTVEEGTPLHTLVATGRTPDVDPDVQASRHGIASQVLSAAGYQRYEISNWSRPGQASRHNVLYWSAGDYVGFGAGAHSHMAGHRWWTVRLPRDYISLVADGSSTMAGEESLDPDRRAGEALMLGLRLASGVDTEAFETRFPGALAERAGEIDRLIGLGLLERAGGSLRLSTHGTLLANDVLSGLL